MCPMCLCISKKMLTVFLKHPKMFVDFVNQTSAKLTFINGLSSKY
jgi:hypothetical protein